MSNVSAISCRDKIHLIKMMMMMSALYETKKFCWFIVLAQWNNSQRVDMSLHSVALSW